MILGLNDADCLAAAMRHDDLRSAAERNRSAANRGIDQPARSRGFAALIARFGPRPRVTPEASGAAAAPSAALGSAR